MRLIVRFVPKVSHALNRFIWRSFKVLWGKKCPSVSGRGRGGFFGSSWWCCKTSGIRGLGVDLPPTLPSLVVASCFLVWFIYSPLCIFLSPLFHFAFL